MISLRTVWIVGLTLFLALGAGAANGDDPPPVPLPAGPAGLLPPELPAVPATIEVAFGDQTGVIELLLYPNLAPITVANFITHARRGTYKGSSFDRVIKRFALQGGKPADQTKKFDAIVGEFGRMSHKRGVISMARSDDPNSATTEFFIVHADQPDLDPVQDDPTRQGYAAFGRVTNGMQWVDQIAELPKIPNPAIFGERSLPKDPVRIVDITIPDTVDLDAITAYALLPKGELVLSLLGAQSLYLAGGAVPVQLLMQNGGEGPVYADEMPTLVQGLYLVDHVSGESFAPQIAEDDRLRRRKPDLLMPGAFYGKTIDIAQWFPDALRNEGQYALLWAFDRAQATPAQLIVRNDRSVVLHTNAGEIEIEVDLDIAPMGASSFLDMMAKGAFNKARIVPPKNGALWVDVLVPNDQVPDKPLATEDRKTRFEEGTVIYFPLKPLVKRSEDEELPTGLGLKGTDGHFRILTGSEPALDGTHASIGRVIRGIELVKAMLSEDGVLPLPPDDAASDGDADSDADAKVDPADPPEGVHMLTIESVELKRHKARPKAPREKIRGSLHATLDAHTEVVTYGEPLFIRFAVGNDGDWHVKTNTPLSLGDELVLVDEDQREYAPTLRPLTTKREEGQPYYSLQDLYLPRPGGGTVESGEFLGITIDMDKLFPELATGGHYAVLWKRDKKRRAIAGVTVNVVNHARVLLEDGEFTIELFAKETPLAVAAFKTLVARGFYDDTIFHHVVKTNDLQLVQAGGKPEDPAYIAEDLGPIPLELSRYRFNAKGVVGLAHRAGRLDEGISQFFINLDEAPMLSGQYTAFGRVIEGMAVVKTIREGTKIRSIELFLRLKIPESETP